MCVHHYGYGEPTKLSIRVIFKKKLKSDRNMSPAHTNNLLGLPPLLAIWVGMVNCQGRLNLSYALPFDQVVFFTTIKLLKTTAQNVTNSFEQRF